MQNRYVGDVGTFGQLGLLRWLTGMTGPTGAPEESLQLGVVWYMYHDFDNAGGRVGYLGNPRRYRECDADLFDALGGLVRYGNRNIRAVQQSGILPSDTSYYDKDLIYDPEVKSRDRRKETRRNWVDSALDAVAESEVVFIDPDTGIAVDLNKVLPGDKSHFTRKYPFRKCGPKYVLLEELKRFADPERGQSLVIYQHLRRGGKASQFQHIKDLAKDLTKELEPAPCQISALVYRDGSAAYLIVTRPGKSQHIIKKRLKSFCGFPSAPEGPWRELFKRIV